MPTNGIRILEIIPDSPADRAGLMAGDRILTLNGHEIPDELSLRFHFAEGAEDDVVLSVQSVGGKIRKARVDAEDVSESGIVVEEFPTQRCNNACVFCFVDQLPAGVRPGLKVKDDDYRLSFLYGNYVTLTNVTEKELDRIIDERLSPLYVSVHATDPELRTRILGRKRPDNLEKKLKKLVRGGIRIHAQIVLMPGINDGGQLEKTVFDLYALRPELSSVAIVPVGLSDFAPKDKGLCPVTPEFSRELLCRVKQWQKRFKKEFGENFVFPADEFYLLAGKDVPASDFYEDFAQIEDGVGMVRRFIDDFADGLSRRRKHFPNLRGTLVTGKLFFPILRRCVRQLNSLSGATLTVRAAENHFLGEKITVAGLLAGKDILDALSGRDFGDFAVIPGEALSGDGLFVDDMTLRDLSKELGKPVYSGGRTVRDFFKMLARFY